MPPAERAQCVFFCRLRGVPPLSRLHRLATIMSPLPGSKVALLRSDEKRTGVRGEKQAGECPPNFIIVPFALFILHCFGSFAKVHEKARGSFVKVQKNR